VRLLTSPDARHLVATVAPTWAIAGMATRGDPAALSIFFWFQIPDFHLFFGFFSLCHFIFPSIYLYLGLLPIATARLIVASALNAVTLLVRLGTHVLEYTAPGVFFRFQVSDFDRFLGFFSLCHFIFLAIYFGLFGRCVVSVTPKGN
jgi:hypothetical protein